MLLLISSFGFRIIPLNEQIWDIPRQIDQAETLFLKNSSVLYMVPKNYLYQLSDFFLNF